MERLAKIELSVFLGLLCVFLLFLLPALQYARAETRDGMRRDWLKDLKTELEQENNKTGVYPREYHTGEFELVVEEGDEVRGAVAWYIRTELENTHEDEAGFNDELNVFYRYIREGGVQFYDICGGENTCGVARE